jgi:hypothetical protein
MASKIGKPNANLSDLLSWVDNGELQLPDFQRSWVWDDNRIKELLASVSLGHPIGALLFLEYGGSDMRFQYRPLEGAPKGGAPDFLVLDGQQRLTSLYGALRCKQPVPTRVRSTAAERYYYIDIRKTLDSSDRSDAIVSIPANRMVREDFDRSVRLDISTRELEFEHLLFPLNITFDANDSIDWIASCMFFYSGDRQILQMLKTFNISVLNKIQNYALSVIDLPNDTPKDAVCKIFENINTGGVALNAFELVTAGYAADDFNLREEWDHVQTTLAAEPSLRGVSSMDYLTAITLAARYSSKQPVSCRRRDILNLPLDSYITHAHSIEQGFVQAGTFLREQCIYDVKYIPYTTQLTPLAVFYALLGKRLNNHTAQEKLKRWYWCGVLGEVYGSSVETRLAKDVVEFMAWIDGGEEPDTVKHAYFNPARLDALRSKNQAAYSGIMALLMQAGAIDFITGRRMDFTSFVEDGIDIHHIFPLKYAHDVRGFKYEVIDSIINKTPMSRGTNRAVGGVAPSEYLGRIQGKGHVTGDNLERFIESHLVDASDLQSDRFEAYYEKRKKALLSLIGRAMGKPVTQSEPPLEPPLPAVS